MSIADQVQTIARREYELLRTAAKAVDQRLEPAVRNSPGLTSALDRVREVLQDFDDRLSGQDGDADEQPAAPAATTERSPAPRPKPEPEPAATAEVDNKVDPEVDPEVVDEAEVEHLADEFLEEETDHHAGELADNEDLRDVQARLRAKHALQEQHEHDQHGQQT